MKKIILFLSLLVAYQAAFGQGGSPLTPQASATGNITATGSTCATTNACVAVHLQSGVPSVAVTVTGTWSATLTPEQSADNGVTWVSIGTAISANGQSTYTMTAQTDFRIRCSAFTSGTAAVFINVSQPSIVNLGPIIGTSGAINPVLINQTVDVFNRTGSGLGANWTAWLNNLNTTPGAAIGTSASFYSLAAYTGVSTVPTQTCRVSMNTLNSTTDSMGCALRIQGTPTTSVSFYYCTESTTALGIGKVTGAANANNGTGVSLTSTAITGVPGDAVVFTIVGNTMTCTRYSTGGVSTALETNDNSSPLTTGLPGIMQFGNVATYGSFTLTNPTLPSGAQENIVFDGDSIIAANGNGNPGTDPATSFLSISITNAYVVNLGVGSKCVGVTTAMAPGSVESMLTTGTSVVDPLYVPGIKNIVVLAMAGGNDIQLQARTPAQVYTDITTYVTARHAAGWKVIIAPVLSRLATTTPATDQKIAILNSLISANAAAADAVITLPTSLTGMGTSSNTLLFNADQVHPLEITHIDILARSFIAALSKF